MHCVTGHLTLQPGQTARVQKVFQTVPQDGTHSQRSSGCGRHAHLGQ